MVRLYLVVLSLNIRKKLVALQYFHSSSIFVLLFCFVRRDYMYEAYTLYICLCYMDIKETFCNW